MSTPQGSSSRWVAYDQLTTSLILFVLVVCYVWFNIGPSLLYYQHCPVFLTGAEYFRSFTGRPSGLAEYATLFLDQFTCFALAGALVIALVTTLICLTTCLLLSAVADRRGRPWVYCVPAVLLLMLHGRYDYHLMTSVSLLIALACAAGYVSLPLRKVSWRAPIFVVLSVLVYYAAGGMVVLFGVLCGVFELVRRRGIALGIVCILLVAAIPWGFAWYSYEIDTAASYAPLLPFRPEVVNTFSALLTLPGTPIRTLSLPMLLRLALFLTFPLAMIWFGVRHHVLALCRRLLKRGRSEGPAPAAGDAASPGWTPITLVVFVVAAAGLVFWSFDRTRRQQLRIGWYAQHKGWDRLLETADALPPELHDTYTMHDVIRALYHTGQLPDRMFTYPQRYGADSLLLSSLRCVMFGPPRLKSCVIHFELGQVNHAQKQTHIALETFGERPEILKLLVRINVLKNRPVLARRYLERLGRNMLYRSWAEDYRRRLDADPEADWDDEVRRVRPLIPTDTYGFPGGIAVGYEVMLRQLLRQNPKNRMAFEYLMALYLVKRRPDQILFEMERLNDFEVYRKKTIPRYYEEAIILHHALHKEPLPVVAGRRIGKDAIDRGHAFGRLHSAYERAEGDEKETLLAELKEDYGESYFFYYPFGYSVAKARLIHVDVVTRASP